MTAFGNPIDRKLGLPLLFHDSQQVSLQLRFMSRCDKLTCRQVAELGNGIFAEPFHELSVIRLNLSSHLQNTHLERYRRLRKQSQNHVSVDP